MLQEHALKMRSSVHVVHYVSRHASQIQMQDVRPFVDHRNVNADLDLFVMAEFAFGKITALNLVSCDFFNDESRIIKAAEAGETENLMKCFESDFFFINASFHFRISMIPEITDRH